MKVAFFGTPKISQIVLEKLINSPYKPQLVITGADTQKGRGQKTEITPIKETALKNKIKILQPQTLSEKNFAVEFKTFDPDVAILIAYGKIIPDEILSIPKFGFVNIHPSLLPKYRGPAPITAPILEGDTTTGVSLIVLDSELDHGPIIAQAEVAISETDTHKTLGEKLANTGANLLLKTLPEYLEQNITPESQDHNLATFSKKITKENGKIDIANPPDNITLDRMIRAYYPWPTVWFVLDQKRFMLLPEGQIQPEGKKPMVIKEFLNGYPKYKGLIEKLT